MNPPDPETERIRRIYDRRAATSARPRGDANLRWLCGQAEGETLEIGIGRGRSLPFYPSDVRLTGIELSSVALEAAERRARELGVRAVLQQGDAGAALPDPDGHFDSVVFCFVLCTIPDYGRAISEAVRVLRPGGKLLLLEHVRSPNRAIRAIERLLEPLTLRWEGDHLLASRGIMSSPRAWRSNFWSVPGSASSNGWSPANPTWTAPGSGCRCRWPE
jgi:ubiquinone/menaquinone biosynthesis C-methylase UbiE